MDYIYKAFISYRHQPFDKKIADRLQKMLERYKIPRGIGKKEKWRVFRDETELPTSSDLSGDIKTALEESEFLIVICSRALKKSRWCMEEITYFKELHGGSVKNIITLLVEGRPEEVFPSELCRCVVETIGENGEIIKKEFEVEPLAANISDVTQNRAFKKLKTEFLRIAAPLIGCGYDALYNRDRKRKIKNISAAVSAAFVCVGAFGLYNTAVRMELAEKNAELEEQLAIINSQSEQLNLQNDELDQKNEELENKNSELVESNDNLQKKTKEAEDNLAEANIQKALAEQNQALAEQNQALAEQNQAEAENQRGIAEGNLALLTASNNELLIKAAASAASNAETMFEKGDRIGAIKTALSVRPYADDETKLLPATKKILAEALYAYNTSSSIIADRILETDAPVEFYEYNTEGTVIYAYDSDNAIYIWDVETGKTLLKTSVGENISAFYSLKDEYSFCVVTSKSITAFSLSEGAVIWSITKDSSSSYTEPCISDDGSVLAVISTEDVQYDDDVSLIDKAFGFAPEKTHYGYWVTVSFTDTKTGNVIYEGTEKVFDSDYLNMFYKVGSCDFYENSKFILNCCDYMTSLSSEYNTRFLCFDIENKSSSVINYYSLSVNRLCFYSSQNFAVEGIYYDADTDSRIQQVKSIDLSGKEILSTNPEDSVSVRNMEYMEWQNEKLFVLNSTYTIVLIDAVSGEIYKTKNMNSSIKRIYQVITVSGEPAIYVLYESGEATWRLYNDMLYIGKFKIENEDNYGVNGIAYNKKESYAVLGKDTSAIVLYKEISDNTESYALEEENYATFTLSPDEKFYFCGESSSGSEHKTYIHDFQTKKLIAAIPVYCGNCVFNGNYVVYTENNIATWYNLYTGKEEKRIDLNEAAENDLTTSVKLKVSGDGSTLFFSDDNFIYKPEDEFVKLIPNNNTHLTNILLVDRENKTVTPEEISEYPYLHEYRVNRDGSKIAAETDDYSGEKGKCLYLTDTNTGESIPLTEGRSDYILSNSTNSGGDFIFGDGNMAALSIDNSVIIYNTDDGSVMNTIQLGGISPMKMIFSPDSEYLFVYSNNSVLYKYNVESGEEAGRLTSFKGISNTSSSYPEMYINRQTNELIVNFSISSYTAFIDIDMMEISLELNNTLYGYAESTQELVFSGLKFFPYYNSKQLIEAAEKTVGENL